MTRADIDEQPITAPPEWAGDGGEALFPEARRRQRRRRQITGLIAAAVIACVAAIVALTHAAGHTRPGTDAPRAAAALPGGRFATLGVAGPLAVAPTGELYVTDVAHQRVLVRLRDGRFRVVAGDGTVGFSGDGGPAVRARLTDISDLATAPSGALYIADAGRVREVTPDGVIRTVAGNGRGNASGLVANGTPALAAAFGLPSSIKSGGVPLSIAVGPTGQLYISTGAQVLRLSAGRLEVVPAIIRTGPFRGNLNGRRYGLGPIAVDARGDVDVACVNGWSIWQITGGVAHQVGSRQQWLARRSGGNCSVLERAPDGTVYGENGDKLLHIAPNGPRVSLAFNQRIAHEFFWLTYFAFAPNGTLYADEIAGGGAFEARQQLLAVTRAGAVRLLWEQSAHPRAGRGV